ncbi:MAG: hypothetical protein Q4F79_13250 [Eubacteriales bacterium]|nr:hypothetical protein [Eubacteriales bacterium]
MTIVGIYILMGLGAAIGFVTGRISAVTDLKEDMKRAAEKKAQRDIAQSEKALERAKFISSIDGWY